MNTAISYTIDGKKKIDGINNSYKNMSGGNEKRITYYVLKLVLSLLKELENKS
jgi:hypothetical protein